MGAKNLGVAARLVSSFGREIHLISIIFKVAEQYKINEVILEAINCYAFPCKYNSCIKIDRN